MRDECVYWLSILPLLSNKSNFVTHNCVSHFYIGVIIDTTRVFVVSFLLESEVVIMKKRVAAYCRISSNSKEQQTSGNAQVKYYSNLFHNNDNYIIV